jgi:endonuclease/exonuclease/phosphatase family metal-dependent hydrolase
MEAILQSILWLINHLRLFSRRFLYFPFRSFRLLFSMVAAVKEPTNQVIYYATPATQTNAKPCKPITIISANLWHDWPRHRQLFPRLSAFADLAETEAADIVLLQEVARTTKLKVDEWLAERLGMGYAYARANGHESGIGFEEGLAVFSRFPLGTPQWHQLGASALQMSQRMALGANVNTPCGNLMVYSVHLGIYAKENFRQINRLQDWIGSTASEQTALIGGDFNAHENKSQIHHIQKRWLDIFRYMNPDGDGTTHEIRWPWGQPLRRHRLDYLFMQKGGTHWNVLDAKHISAKVGKGFHSDHRAVMARVVPAFHTKN